MDLLIFAVIGAYYIDSKMVAYAYDRCLCHITTDRTSVCHFRYV